MHGASVQLWGYGRGGQAECSGVMSAAYASSEGQLRGGGGRGVMLWRGLCELAVRCPVSVRWVRRASLIDGVGTLVCTQRCKGHRGLQPFCMLLSCGMCGMFND